MGAGNMDHAARPFNCFNFSTNPETEFFGDVKRFQTRSYSQRLFFQDHSNYIVI